MPTDSQRRNLASAHHADVARLERKSAQDDESILWQAAEISKHLDKISLLEQQLAEAREDAEIKWPKARDVGRYGDMSPAAHMRVGLDSDNDVYVSVWDDHGGGCVEFCNGGGGGGSSMKTSLALIALMVAMEEDNAARPDKDWWARRAAGSAAPPNPKD